MNRGNFRRFDQSAARDTAQAGLLSESRTVPVFTSVRTRFQPPVRRGLWRCQQMVDVDLDRDRPRLSGTRPSCRRPSGATVRHRRPMTTVALRSAAGACGVVAAMPNAGPGNFLDSRHFGASRRAGRSTARRADASKSGESATRRRIDRPGGAAGHRHAAAQPARAWPRPRCDDRAHGGRRRPSGILVSYACHDSHRSRCRSSSRLTLSAISRDGSVPTDARRSAPDLAMVSIRNIACSFKRPFPRCLRRLLDEDQCAGRAGHDPAFPGNVKAEFKRDAKTSKGPTGSAMLVMWGTNCIPDDAIIISRVFSDSATGVGVPFLFRASSRPALPPAR